MLAYSRLIIREALKHGSSGWLDYDRVFRRQVAINPLLPWNVNESSLQAMTILGQRSGTVTFCTLCYECDHLAAHCALAPLQPNIRPVPAPPNAQRQEVSAQHPPRWPETLLHICVAWNKGICRRPSCTFCHICTTCQHSHRARDCADTPADSKYKSLPVLPPSTSARVLPKGRS